MDDPATTFAKRDGRDTEMEAVVEVALDTAMEVMEEDVVDAEMEDVRGVECGCGYCNGVEGGCGYCNRGVVEVAVDTAMEVWLRWLWILQWRLR